MQRSTEEILTTHTGSLPRPPELTDALRARDRGEPAPPDLDDQIRAAVTEVVGRQTQAGVTVVNDGEAGKIGYSTYVKERLDGFGGEGGIGGIPTDLTDYPDYLGRVMGAGIDFAMPACVGPVSYRDRDAVPADIANLKAAVADANVKHAFMTAASPGVISFFLTNQYYPTHEEYIAALADVMKGEYDEIHQAELVLQLDCPDLAMTHHMTPGESLEDFAPARRCTSRRSTTRRVTFPPIRCGSTSAGVTTRALTTTTFRCARSSTSCSVPDRRRSRSRPPIPATSTSGRCSTT
jgi:5-methyltetrahydropteroyltriglutamate--homocysteine methyltransferase